MRTNLGACCAHEGGVRHKQVCTRVDSDGQKLFLTLPRRRESNPGSSDLSSDSLTTEPRSTRLSVVETGLPASTRTGAQRHHAAASTEETPLPKRLLLLC